MTYLYTTEERQNTLQTLRIKPKNGKITGQEAAAIMTWRAKNEFKVEHVYSPSILRRHVEKGNIKAYPGTKLTEKTGESRKSLYDVKDVFELSIEPRRGRKLTSST